MTPEEVRVYERLYDNHGLGLACGLHTVSIDIDADDQVLARELISAAEQAFSRTPLVRGGKGPGVNMIYACSEPVITYTLPWLEILGLGRYVVAYGDHPNSGQSYRWILGHSPVDTPAWELPGITQASINLYVKAVCPILGVDYADIGLDTGQQHSEWMLSSRSQLVKQLALTILKGKTAAKTRARKVLRDGIFHVPTLRVRGASTEMHERH